MKRFALGVALVALLSPLAFGTPAAWAQYVIDRRDLALRDDGDRLLELGKYQLRQGQPRKAYESWQQALQRYQHINDDAATGRVLGLLGALYAQMGGYDAAYDTFLQRRGYANTLDEPLGQIAATNNLTAMALPSGDRLAAEAWNAVALELAQQYENHKGLGLALNHRGQLAAAVGQHLRAIKLYYQSLPYRYPIHDLTGEAITYIRRGDSYAATEDYANAISDYGMAMVMAKQTKDLPLQAAIAARMVGPYLALPNEDRAEDWMKKRLELAQALDDPQTIVEVERQLGELYLERGDRDRAIAAYRRSMALAAKLEDRLAAREAYARLHALNAL